MTPLHPQCETPILRIACPVEQTILESLNKQLSLFRLKHENLNKQRIKKQLSSKLSILIKNEQYCNLI